jgi:hypothetical protein
MQLRELQRSFQNRVLRRRRGIESQLRIATEPVAYLAPRHHHIVSLTRATGERAVGAAPGGREFWPSMRAVGIRPVLLFYSA